MGAQIHPREERSPHPQRRATLDGSDGGRLAAQVVPVRLERGESQAGVASLQRGEVALAIVDRGDGVGIGTCEGLVLTEEEGLAHHHRYGRILRQFVDRLTNLTARLRTDAAGDVVDQETVHLQGQARDVLGRRRRVILQSHLLERVPGRERQPGAEVQPHGSDGENQALGDHVVEDALPSRSLLRQFTAGHAVDDVDAGTLLREHGVPGRVDAAQRPLDRVEIARRCRSCDLDAADLPVRVRSIWLVAAPDAAHAEPRRPSAARFVTWRMQGERRGLRHAARRGEPNTDGDGVPGRDRDALQKAHDEGLVIASDLPVADRLRVAADIADDDVGLAGAVEGERPGLERPDGIAVPRNGCQIGGRALLVRPALNAARVGGAIARAGNAVEQTLGRSAGDHGVGHPVGLLLVVVARTVQTLERDRAGTLLHDVGGLVGGRVQVRRRSKGHMVPGRIRLGAERSRRRRGSASDVGVNVREIVVSESPLDRGAVGQGRSGTSKPGARDRRDLARLGARRCVHAFPLDGPRLRQPSADLGHRRYRASEPGADLLPLYRLVPRLEQLLHRGRRPARFQAGQSSRQWTLSWSHALPLQGSSHDVAPGTTSSRLSHGQHVGRASAVLRPTLDVNTYLNTSLRN